MVWESNNQFDRSKNEEKNSENDDSVHVSLASGVSAAQYLHSEYNVESISLKMGVLLTHP